MKLEDASAEAIQSLTAYLKQGVDFSVEQAPGLAQEFLAWAMVAHSFGAICGWLLFGLCFMVIWCIRNESGGGYGPNKYDLIRIFGTTLALAGMILGLKNVHQLLYVIYAPRVYLLENLAKLL